MTAKRRVNTTLIGSIIDYVLTFLTLFVAMYIAEALINAAIFGGALFIAGQFWISFVRLYRKKTATALPSSMQKQGVFLFIVALLIDIALLFFFYPSVSQVENGLILLFSILLILLRQIATDLLSTRNYSSFLTRSFVLLLAHVAFIAFGMLVFRKDPASNVYAETFFCLALIGVPLLIKQLFWPKVVERYDPASLEEDASSATSMLEVSSYRIYNRMVTSIFVAANLSITMYIFYLRYLPYTGIIESFLGLAIWLCFIALITALVSSILRRRTGYRYDKPSLFVFGALLWIVPTILIYNGTFSFTGYNVYLVGALYGIGLSCMLSIIISMGIEMKTVIEIGVGKIDNGAYERNTRVMIEWSVLLSQLLILIVATIAAFILEDKLAVLDEVITVPKVLQLITFLLPMLFVVIALIYMMLQPLDKQYAEKLRLYRRTLHKGELNKPLEDKLKKVLVASTPKRIGIRILKFLARPFVPMRIVGKENVEIADKPVIFVCNHMEIYGPVAAVVRIPYYFRPWIIHKLLSKDIIMEGLTNGINRMFRFLPASWRNGIKHIAAPLILWIVNSLDPIPVYRNTSREVVQTIRLTVEALECEDNILIFPENPKSADDGFYATSGINEFFSGFSSIGRKYYHATGKCVTFIPIFINKSKHTLTFGRGVQFDPDNAKGEEKKRIVDTLYNRMNDMAGNGDEAQ